MVGKKTKEVARSRGLIEALTHKKSFVRYNAARTLGEIGDVRAVEPLIQTLKDKDKNVRLEATRALGRIGDVRAVEPLIQALKDESWSVRWVAAWALDSMGKPAVEPLVQTLKDEDWHVQHKAAEALGMCTRTSLKFASIACGYFQAELTFLAANLPIREFFQAMPMFISKQGEIDLKPLLKRLKKDLEAYQRLEEIGESKGKLNEEWRSELEDYRAMKVDIESKISLIEGLIKARVSNAE